MRIGHVVGLSLASLWLLGSSAAGAATTSISDLQKRVDALEQQVKQAAKTEQELEALKAELKAAEDKAAAAQATAEKVAAITPPSDDDSLIKFHLDGAVVADFVASDMKGSHNSFVAGKFLPIFLASYSDWLLFEGHMEFTSNSDGSTNTSLEYAQLDFLVNDWLTVVAGKFLSPIGQFQQALHPPWINKLPDRPAGFVEDGGDEPLNDVGIMARGGFPVGSMKGTYAVYVGNGPRMGDMGPVLEGFANDNNDDKAFGGRVSLFVLPHLEIGLSGMHAKIKGMEAMAGAVSQADYELIGGDFAYTRGNWDVRGEYIHSHLGAINSALDPSDPAPTAIPATTWNNWYVQAAYRLAGVSDNPVIANFEPAIRYSQLHVDGFNGFKGNEESRWSAGLDYWFAPSVVAKIAYENRHFPHAATDNVFHAQVAFGF
ncbi:MAG: hypothetical protein KGO02_01795 [Alphaproteobacteria bacterium]|nr:hypothetical protein [Alphaproteobacteria bacterium]